MKIILLRCDDLVAVVGLWAERVLWFVTLALVTMSVEVDEVWRPHVSNGRSSCWKNCLGRMVAIVPHKPLMHRTRELFPFGNR